MQKSKRRGYQVMIDKVTDAVSRQYETFPYPPPDVNRRWSDLIEVSDPSMFSPLLWPEGRPRESLRILIAGCGTVQAARCALRNPSCQVLGIDISDAAIAAHERLKCEHNLANLELRKLDLRAVGDLGRSFDLISSIGVLHHLTQPEEGLRSLSTVLDPHGAMIIMLYGSAARAGVYLLQDALRRMELGIDQESIELARSMIRNLPEYHYFNWYSSNAPDLKSDAGLVDTLLHAQDRAYSVPQVLQFVENCGLQFQSWEDNYFYFPDASIRSGSPLWDRLKVISEREQWAVIENLMLTIGRHTFVACRPERRYREISFSDTGYFSYVPKMVPGIAVVERGSLEPPRPASCRRGKLEFSMSYAEAMLFSSCDGKRTIAQILEHPMLASYAAREEFGRAFFERMWKLGHLWMLTAPL
jgi:SAM-dependent methyltransferase